jgi:Peptidyl-tRNA hydrolase PTH2
VIRSDLKMSIGKMIAQACHASDFSQRFRISWHEYFYVSSDPLRAIGAVGFGQASGQPTTHPRTRVYNRNANRIHPVFLEP